MRKRIIIFVVSMLFLTGSINVLEKSVYAQDELETISITYTDNLTITLHKITSVEINELKQEIGVYEEGKEKNYSIIISGHTYYTGLRPPTEEEWSQIEGEGLVVDDISFSGILPSSIDNSNDPWFPPIGSQDGERSCVCWAVGYYVKTYQEAKEHGWNLSGAEWVGDHNGHPSLAYQDKIMSPDFIYHQINDGADRGSCYYSAINIIHQIGACSWKEMPYDPDDHTSFPSESAWREAPLYRGNTGINTMKLDTNDGINNLKAFLAGDELAVISIDHTQYRKLGENNLWTLDNYEGGSGHANTVVGYDDNFGPYVEEGEDNYGAFKIVNSWGSIHSTYWISYEAMKQRVKHCMLFEDKIDYEPQLLSVLQIDHPIRNDFDVTLGLDITEKDGLYLPTEPKTFSFSMAGSCPFPNNKIVLDITEFTDGISEIEGEKFFLKVYERGGIVYVPGTLTYFSVEYYDDYDSGIPTITAISEDPPIETVGNSEVIAELVVPSSNVRLYTDKETYSVGENVTITLENNGNNSLILSTSAPWVIQKNVNGRWGPIYAPNALQVITPVGPGERKTWVWSQNDIEGKQVESGDYRVAIGYSLDSGKYAFTKYAYFSVGEKIVSPLCVYTDKSIYASDEKVSISAQNIGTDALSLKKWYVEKKTLSGIWETIYESPRFSDYFVVIPINEIYTNHNIESANYSIVFPYNSTYWTIANTSIFENWTAIENPDESIIVLPNETVGIWINDTLVIGNWTTIALFIGNQSSGISITDSVSDGNITGWNIETPVIDWTSGSPGWINYTAVTNSDAGLDTQISTSSDIDLPVVTFDMFSTGDAIATNDDLIFGKDFTFIEGDDIFNITPIDWPYGTPVTLLLPNQKLTWNWSQITSDGEKPDFGEYHIKVEYDDSYATSAPFLICMVLEILEIYDQGGNDTIVERQYDGTYLIDGDADGHWDYTYNPTTGTTNPFIEKKESETSGKISWTTLGGIIIIVVLVLLAVVVYLYKKQRL